MRKRIRVHAGRCSGCRACVVACVVQHDGLFGTATARLHVHKDDAAGSDEPRVCRQCRKAPCLAACPTGALYRDERTGMVRLQPGRCDGCRACTAACPFHALALHPTTGEPLVCDLCGGDPACVRRCATGAIAWK